MRFAKDSASIVPLKDTVFAVARRAKEDMAANGDQVIDATIGSLISEDGKFVALNSVFRHYDEIDDVIKASYASGMIGNPSYRKQVYSWILGKADLALSHSVIATPGGTGAVSAAMMSFLDEGQTVIVPEIGWISYDLMAAQYNLKALHYELFDGDRFDLASFEKTIQEAQKTQDRVVAVINDPCHNPTGYTLSSEEWAEIIAILNRASEKGPVILINDIAYIDYSFHLSSVRDYLTLFNGFSDGVMAVIAFSTSKTLTSYGLRCGAAILLARNETDVRDAETVMEKTARAGWSNIANAAMENFVWVTTEGKEAYLEEKQKYIDLLKQRSDLFLKEARDCQLPIYPYREGFFITIREKDNAMVEKIHNELMNRHIYTVTVNKGIRVAICSLPIRKIQGLAAKIREVMDFCRKGE